MRRLPAALRLAQEMGSRLGECEVLFRVLSQRGAPIRLEADNGAVVTVPRSVLGYQLQRDLSALAGLDRACDIVLMLEVVEENIYVRCYKKKIVLAPYRSNQRQRRRHGWMSGEVVRKYC